MASSKRLASSSTESARPLESSTMESPPLVSGKQATALPLDWDSGLEINAVELN